MLARIFAAVAIEPHEVLLGHRHEHGRGDLAGHALHPPVRVVLGEPPHAERDEHRYDEGRPFWTALMVAPLAVPACTALAVTT
ncbi:hypothetical protein Acor_30020 [Acrocarpospora corrugata]|uniref:Uncharacterized protein n=1 Tax=Acrocarpospora corrugata TaxID=35763 RepID=A0A5M3W2W0_9ACTN|nr:hypothetical protein [Acrocarpospora corrugata]GES00938.1 hypothetical protein Acor_30020 [Acrocarpospora corrugata]